MTEENEKQAIEQVKPEPQQYPPLSRSFFFTPLSERGVPTWAVYVFAVLGLIYMLNPTLGILEFIPDNLPVVGNLDEGVAFMLVWAGLVEYFEGHKNRKA
jgi:uncharacterized membrane protein YkvA (DUF1232 family)